MKAIMVAVTGLVVCVHKLTTRGSDTSSLERGDCVKVNGVGSTFSGNVENVSCSKVEPLSDYYRVKSVGSESDMDRRCRMRNLEIADEGDAACLTQ